MPFKPIPLKVWIKFLKYLGLVELPESSGTSHCQWNYPPGDPRRLNRPITFRKSSKDIPGFHIKTNLTTLSMTWDDMEKIMRKHC